jgi:histidinol-phosphatase (PHP family)
MQPEEVVKEAIAAGIKFMCFTDHYPDPEGFMDPDWPTDNFFKSEYIREVRRLQKAYSGRIDISFGVELDWVDSHKDWTKEQIAKNEFDYILGSVHNIPLKGEYYSFDFGDGRDSKFLELAEKFGSVEKMIAEYYSQLRLMASSRMYDAVGHFDYIKRYNTDEKIFSESSDFYKDQIIKTLEIIAKSGMALEINMRGLKKSGKAQYPSLWILKEARKRNIPLTIGTDAHRSGEVGDLIENAYDLARQAGYKEIVRFKDRKRISIPI